jgi:DNA primase catalytic core
LSSKRFDYIVDPAGPNGKVDGAADAKEAITDNEKRRLYAATMGKDLTGDMLEMYDEMAANWGNFNRAQARNLANYISAQPATDRGRGQQFAQWYDRKRVREALSARAVPDDALAAIADPYRKLVTKSEIQTALDLLHTFPLKKYASAAKTETDKTAEPASIQPPSEGKLRALTKAFLNHKISDEEIVKYDDIQLNPENYDYREVQRFIEDLNGREVALNNLASSAQRQFFRVALSREDGSPWYDELLENMYKYSYAEADQKIKEIADSPNTTALFDGAIERPDSLETGAKKTADEIARENGKESAAPEYLGTDVPVGQDRPTNAQLVFLEALIENRDFSSKTSTEDLQTFMKYHRTLPYQMIKDYIDTFKELPFKDGFSPRQLSTNLTMEEGGPSPRMLRALERKYAKGLISEEMWQSMISDIPNMKLGVVADRYIKPLDSVETLHDDAILRKSIEGGFEIAGLRVPKNSTVEIPEDYQPTQVGKWIAPTEEEVNKILDAGGATPNVADTTIDPDALEASLNAKTSGEAEDILDKAEYDTYLQREALRADLKRARQTINIAIREIVDALQTPRRVLKADARKILEKTMTDLSALRAVVDLRRKNIPNVAEFDRRLNAIAAGVLPLGDDSASPYGVLKTRTPEVLQLLQDVQGAVLQGVGTYSAGRFQYQDSLAIEDMATPTGKPSMKFFYPPAFDGPAMDGLRAATSYEEIVNFFMNTDFYVLDLETTGLVDLDDREVKNDPIQVAVTKVSGLRVVDQYATYINPESKISSYSLKGVGDGRGGKVTPEFLEGFPTKREAMEQLLQFVPRGSIVVGHNALMFDLEVIERTIAEAGLDSLSPSGVMDTLGLARYIMPEWTPSNPDAPFKINAYGQQNKSFSLEALVNYFGLSNNGRHEADADVASTVEVLQKMLDRAQRGFAVGGKDFDFDTSTNGWNRSAYEAAQDAYKQQVAEYILSSEIEQESLDEIIDTVSRSVDSAQGANREPVTIPAANTLRDLHAGAYVFDTKDGRVGVSLGIVGDKILVDMPAPDVLASGKFVLDKIQPGQLAKVTDRFVSKNGALIERGMEVSSSDIPNGSGYVRTLTGDDKNVVVQSGLDFVSVAASNLNVIPVEGDSAATQKQESMIVNLIDELVSEKVLDRAAANAIQKAADAHLYTEDAANSVIMRLTTAAQQKRQLDANSDIPAVPGESAAPRAVIEDMATRKPKDKKTLNDLNMKEVTPLLSKLEKKPTKEMKNIITSIVNGFDTVVKALAGTGKTSTLRSAASVLLKLLPSIKILYIVFNKENQLEADETMPPNTESRTSDSIGFNAQVNKDLRVKFKELSSHSSANIGKAEYPLESSVGFIYNGPMAAINPRRMADLVEAFGIKNTKLSGGRSLPPDQVARAAYMTLTNFVLSDDAKISDVHIPYQDMGGLAPKTDEDKILITSLAEKMWNNILEPYRPHKRQILIDHIHMFKNWALTNPNLIEVDSAGKSVHGLAQVPNVIFLDEAQDINPAFLGLLKKQKTLHKNGIQVVAVGDTNQKIFGFRGTADALRDLPRDLTLSLTKSFRTGDGILQYANKVLRMLKEPLQLVGRDEDGSKLINADTMNDPDLVITRTNTGILSAGVWADLTHPGERIATTAAFKDRLLTVVKTLDWIIGNNRDKPIRPKPSKTDKDLQNYLYYDEIQDAAENDPYFAMIVNMLNGVRKRLAKQSGGLTKAVKLYEAVKDLERILKNFRVYSDLFKMPSSIGTEGNLGGNISYSARNGKVFLSDSEYMRNKRFGYGVKDNQVAIEDAGFKRIEDTKDGKRLWIWTAPESKDLKKQLADLVTKLRGEDAIMRIMTGHTAKGLEAPKVKLWTDWKRPKRLSAEELRLSYVAITRAKDELDLGGLSWILETPDDVEYIENMATPKKVSGPANRNYLTDYESQLRKEQRDLDLYQRELKSVPFADREYNRDDKELSILIAGSKARIKAIKDNPNMFEASDMDLLKELKTVLPKITALVKDKENNPEPLSSEEEALLDRFNANRRSSFAMGGSTLANLYRLRGAEGKIAALNTKLGADNWLPIFVEQMATLNGDNVTESNDVIVPADGLEGSDTAPVDDAKAAGIRSRNSEVTNRIVGEILEQMEKGMVPWRKPWTSDGVMPTSGATGRVYRGLNLLYLMMEMQWRSHKGNRFYTKNAISKMGGFLDKDAKPSIISKVTIINTEKEQDVRKPDPDRPGQFITVREKVKGKIPRLELDVVYNEDYIKGVELPKVTRREPPAPSEIEKIVLASYANAPEINFLASDSAYWDPATDTINLPKREQFSSEEDFLDTLFHELTHSTGHENRLNRKDLLANYGTHKNVRAREELIAEIGGAIISQMFNIDAAFDNSLSYIQGWSTFLKEEPNALFEASSLASKAVEHILGGYWASEDGLVDLSEESVYTPTEAIDMPEGEITGEPGTMGGLGSGVNYRIEGDSVILMGNTKGNKDAIKSVSFLPEGGKRPYKFLYHSKNGHWFTTFTGEFAAPNRAGMLNELKNTLAGEPAAVEDMASPATTDASPEMKERLYSIVDEAAKFYNNRMLNFSDATEAVKYFRGRGFSKQDAENFQLGYAPKTWATLYQHLLKKGFTDDEMITSGLVKRSERTGRLFDALRDRIVFPIKESDGRAVGFTGRAVNPDEEIRYMLTSNSPIYQKSEVLFGLDQAKDAIAETGEMIVVEGQFDALAMHAAGFKNAVATSGTNFGSGHVKLFEDIAGDKKRSIIFSYDPDVAGVKAAESVYEMLKNSGIDLYAVSGESDLDPAEIYSKDNEEGLKTLIDNKLPMLEHLIERIIATGNISTIEGRIAAIRAITKLLSGVEDQGLVSQLVSKYAARLDTTEDSMMEAIAQNL